MAASKATIRSSGGAAALAAKQADIARAQAAFSFVPEELTGKCAELIARYHAANDCACLADMLWHGDARDLLTRNKELKQIFKSSCKIRSTQQANKLLLFVATAVVSLEALARDFAGWGTLYPDAKRRAEETLGGSPLRSRAWLMDTYVYPSSGISRDLVGRLAPSGSFERASDI
jgi:hypothetical protein